MIVVDNGSTDSTATILQDLAFQHPLITLFEPRAGKNVALNRALTAANGDLLIFTDDDVILPKNFLVAYEELSTKQTEFSLFGGHIVAHWEAMPDQNLLKEIPLGIAYSITEDDRTKGEIKAGRIYGPNMAVRSKVFDSGLRYDESIGPNGKLYVMGSETEFLHRAEVNGFRAYFDPSIVVGHRVDKHQFDRNWLSNRAFKAGRAMVHDQIRKGVDQHSSKRIFGCPRWAVRKYIEAEARVLANFTTRRKQGAYSARWQSAFLKGYLYEIRRH